MIQRALLTLALALFAPACSYLSGPSAPVKAFLDFREAQRNGNCPDLYTLAAPNSPAWEWIDGYCNAGRYSGANFAAQMSGSPGFAMMKFKRKVESKEKQADGSVKLVIRESVGGRPSNFNKPAPPRRYRVTVKPVDGVWRLSEYADEDIVE
jgi:hypothetical protein